MPVQVGARKQLHAYAGVRGLKGHTTMVHLAGFPSTSIINHWNTMQP